MDRALDPDRRATLLEGQMTVEEKLAIVQGPMGRVVLGFIPGVPRLGRLDGQAFRLQQPGDRADHG